MNAHSLPIKIAYVGLAAALAGALIASLTGRISVLTPDQRAYRLFIVGDYQEAAERFTDPMWKGVALFEEGGFKEAEGVFAGFDTADAAFNQGNALVMQGKYDDAASRYMRALQLKPDWEAAIVNHEIALSRAAFLQKEGGDMTGGEMGADEIVFEKGNPPPSAGEEQIDESQEMSDAEMRSIWLRQVRTKPADFLRAKFAYQHAAKTRQSE